MTWQRSVLTLQKELSNVTCSTLSVSPWTYGAGQKTPAGTFLSPENAINILKDKLNLVDEKQQIIIFLQTDSKLENLITQITALNNVLPIPQIQSTLRKAQSMLNLLETRMQIPNFSAGLPPIAELAAKTIRDIEKSQTISSAINSAKSAINPDQLLNKVKEFSNVKQSIQNEISKNISSYLEPTKLAVVHSIIGNRDFISREIVKNIPNPDHIYTCAQMFVGTDLTHIQKMINVYVPERS